MKTSPYRNIGKGVGGAARGAIFHFTRNSWDDETHHDSLLNFRLGILYMVLTLLLDQLCYQPCPTRLMARADAGASITMEIFKEGNVIAPVSVILECFVFSKNSAASVRIAQENVDQAV